MDCIFAISSDYKALFYVGGHGPMFDLPQADDVANIAAKIYEAGGVLGAVCHGTVGQLLCNVQCVHFATISQGVLVKSYINFSFNIVHSCNKQLKIIKTFSEEKKHMYVREKLR